MPVGCFVGFLRLLSVVKRCLVYPRCFVCLALLIIVLLNSITAEQAVTSHNFKIRVYSYFPLYVNPIFIHLAAALFGSRPPPFTAKTRTRQKELESSNIARAKIKVVSDILRRILSFVSGSHLLFQMRRFYLRCFGLFRLFPSFAWRCVALSCFPRCFVCSALFIIVLLSSVTCCLFHVVCRCFVGFLCLFKPSAAVSVVSCCSCVSFVCMALCSVVLFSTLLCLFGIDVIVLLQSDENIDENDSNNSL